MLIKNLKTNLFPWISWPERLKIRFAFSQIIAIDIRLSIKNIIIWQNTHVFTPALSFDRRRPTGFIDFN